MTVVDVARDRCLAELRERGLLPDSYEAVYLAGSLLRGWGNPSSDLDVYVIVTEPWTRESAGWSAVSVQPSRVPVEVFHLDGRRWDVEYWLDSQVDDLLDQVSWESFEAGRATGDSLTKADIAMAQRLPFAGVVAGGEWVRRRTAQFAESSIKTMMATRALYQLDLLAEDALGMLAAGDVNSAVLAAHLAFGYAVEALLCSYGEFNEQEKWRARRLESVEPAELGFKDYWDIETMRFFNADAPATWVEDVLGVCQRLAMEVKL